MIIAMISKAPSAVNSIKAWLFHLTDGSVYRSVSPVLWRTRDCYCETGTTSALLNRAGDFCERPPVTEERDKDARKKYVGKCAKITGIRNLINKSN